ncbi:MAG: hypothetical protein JKX91_09925 [Rhizobiaceae bacterium]|nr:hypothetical protein [Rhizobiaceae bacterium]
MFSKTYAVLGAVVVAATLAATSVTLAMPVNFGTTNSGNVTPDVIFGSGNANGSWTGVNTGGIEVALRGKLRYDTNGSPQNIFNYDGDHT